MKTLHYQAMGATREVMRATMSPVEAAKVLGTSAGSDRRWFWSGALHGVLDRSRIRLFKSAVARLKHAHAHEAAR